MTRRRGGPKEVRARVCIDDDFLNFPNSVKIKEREREREREERDIPSSIWIDEIINYKVGKKRKAKG
jgi:hypothetical protein